jgi:hypothetical protein
MTRSLVALIVVSCGHHESSTQPPACSPEDVELATVTVNLAGTATSIPGSFLGFGMEPGELSTFTGTASDPNPLFTQLLENLAELNGPPAVRIGGDKQDVAYWASSPQPSGGQVALSGDDVRSLDRAVAPAGTKVILGLDLKLLDPAITVAEATGALGVMSADRFLGFEIGNEPDLYGPHGVRPSGYSIDDYGAEYRRFAQAIRAATGPAVPLVGASFSGPFQPSLPAFIAADADLLGMVTLHHYPMSACPGTPAPFAPSLERLLSDDAATGHPRAIAPLVQGAHAQKLALRVDELNSVVCHGADGVSNTFAAALWIIDILFNYASVGVDGVNVHAHPEGPPPTGDFYRPFGFDRDAEGDHAHVYPLYHGIFLFAKAAANHARILPANVTTDRNLRAWPTVDGEQVTRVVIINKDPGASGDVIVTGVPTTGCARVTRLSAPDVSAKSGVMLGGQTFEGTTDGKLVGVADHECIQPASGAYRVPMCGAGAALIEVAK